MELEQVRALLKTLGVHNLTHSGGVWAQASCPLSPFTHAGGRDGNPSFGVTIGLEESHYNCYACNRGTLTAMVQEIQMHLKRRPELADRYDLKNAFAILADEEVGLAPLPKYSEFSQSPYAEFEPWPEWFLEGFSAWDQHSLSAEYTLNTRGIAAATANHFQLRYDHNRSMIGAPFRTASGLLAGMRGRKIVQPGVAFKGLKHYDYEWNKVRNTALTWFNESAFNLPGPLVIVEGQFDLMRLWPYWRKTVAILSSKTTAYKFRKLQDAGRGGVILLLDNPHVDKTASERYPEWQQMLTEKGITNFVVEYPETATWKDPGEAPESWLKEIADELVAYESEV